MHRILVEEEKWIGDERFLHALNYCMLLPGPEAQQLAIYIGWLMHRTVGGVIAGGLFVLPGAIVIMALSYVYAAWGNVSLVVALFFGLKAAVLAIVLQAVMRLGRRAIRNSAMLAIALVSFVAIFAFGLSFPLIILAAAMAGFIGSKLQLKAFQTDARHAGNAKALADTDSLLGGSLPQHARPTVRRALFASGIWLALWLTPVATIVLSFGPHDTFSDIAIFFSKMAVVTFGGAYAVLTYVAQQAVDNLKWLRPNEMLDGLSMAEPTPGPLILVTQFVGYMAAYRHPNHLSPLIAGTLGGLLTTWVTFVPCFLWIFLGAPFIERLRGNRALGAALSAITAAVVGVILNLAVWFALHAWFHTAILLQAFGLALALPVVSSIEPWAIVLSFAAGVAIFWVNAGMLQTLAGCALFGLGLWFAGVIT